METSKKLSDEILEQVHGGTEEHMKNVLALIRGGREADAIDEYSWCINRGFLTQNEINKIESEFRNKYGYRIN